LIESAFFCQPDRTITTTLNHRLQANLIIEIGCNTFGDKEYRGLNCYYEMGPKAAYFAG
jgi:N-acetylmuramoyl-L-alanine amidase